MTQEEKQLLLRDLCARLPYGVKVRGVFLNYNKDKDKILYEECDRELDYRDLNRYESLKPYLFPISSMTEEEREELFNIWKLDKENGADSVTKLLKDIFNKAINENRFLKLCTSFENWIDVMTWPNKKMFDYRGLIPMGLAIEAPKDMYNN